MGRLCERNKKCNKINQYYIQSIVNQQYINFFYIAAKNKMATFSNLFIGNSSVNFVIHIIDAVILD